MDCDGLTIDTDMESKKSNEQEKKKLYVFFSHGRSYYYTHSLYALDLPAPDDTTPTIPTVVTTTTVTTILGTTTENTSTTAVTQGEPKRKFILPVLRFSTRDWPMNMCCVSLDRKLYLLGGNDGAVHPAYSTDVFILDLNSSSILQQLASSSYRNRPGNLMPKGPRLCCGKIDPVISFAACGKIFVLSGTNKCKFTGQELEQFEILSPMEDNKWKFGNKPPFTNLVQLYNRYLIVNDEKVIITGGTNDGYRSWEYDLKLGNWSTLDSTFFYEKGDCQIVDNTIYTVGVGKKTGLPVVIPTKLEDIGKYVPIKEKGNEDNGKNLWNPCDFPPEEDEDNGKNLWNPCDFPPEEDEVVVNGTDYASWQACFLKMGSKKKEENGKDSLKEEENGNDSRMQNENGEDSLNEENGQKENGEDSPMEKEVKEFSDAVPYTIKSDFGCSETLTRIGDNILCFVQVGGPFNPSVNPSEFNLEEEACMKEYYAAAEYHLSVTQFDVVGDSPKHLNSSHYLIFNRDSFEVSGSYLV